MAFMRDAGAVWFSDGLKGFPVEGRIIGYSDYSMDADSSKDAFTRTYVACKMYAYEIKDIAVYDESQREADLVAC